MDRIGPHVPESGYSGGAAFCKPPSHPIGTPAADAFDEFIKEAVLARNDEAVIHYDTHKDADYAVPTKDHFRPLLYALGASEGETPMVYNNIRNLGSMSMTGYIFGMDE